MRYAIISDIHANLQALEAAFVAIKGENIDEIVCLGDVVGYHANPIECINLIRANHKVKYIVQGNHDYESANFDSLSFGQTISISKDAYIGLKYTNKVLGKEDREWLNSLPRDMVIKDKNIPFYIIHTSPYKSDYGEEWPYILNEQDALLGINAFKHKKVANLCFFGHTHVPTLISRKKKSKKLFFDMGRHLENDTYIIGDNYLYLINCGTIGQIRGGGINSFAIFDTKEGTVRIRGFEYDFTLVQKAVKDAGYAEDSRIIERLNPNAKQN